MPDIDYPYHFDSRGRTATADYADHVRDLIEQVLFTSPGERVNRPNFGCGLRQLIFAPASDELATATQFLVQGESDDPDDRQIWTVEVDYDGDCDGGEWRDCSTVRRVEVQRV